MKYCVVGLHQWREIDYLQMQCQKCGVLAAIDQEDTP